MIRKRTMNQLTSTPMRMPKTRISGMEPPPNMATGMVPEPARGVVSRWNGKDRPMAAKWWTLLAVCLAIFMLLLDITIVNVALPDIRRELDSSFTDLQWVVDAYALALAALLLATGSLGDLLGRRRIFVIGILLFVLASLLCGLATTPTILNLARSLQGVGGAMMFANSLALIAQEF